MPTATRLRALLPLSLGLLLVVTSGCSSDPGPGRPGGRMGHRKPPAPLAGQDIFFAGKIVAALSVGDMGLPAGQPDGGDGERQRGSGHGRPAGGEGGFSMGGGHGGGHRERGEGPPGSEGGDRPEGPRPMMRSMGPPVMIHLRFTNQGIERVELRIVDFSSPLGNFAVQPEKLTLEPGQSVETEPMSSLLDEELAETQATLVLRIGDQTEKKVVVLRAVPPVAKTEEPAAPKPSP